MENKAHALAAGLFILGLLVAAAFVGNWLAGDPLVRVAYRVVALQPVTGLNPQGQVRYRGISVGRVAAIDLDLKDPKRIFVDIEVEERIPITRGTYAQLGQEGITGIAYVHLLDEGNDPTPIAGGPSGKPEIPLRASMLDELFDSAGGIAKDARVLAASVQKLLSADNQENFAATLATVKQVSVNLEAASRRLPGTIDRADQMLSEQNRRQLSEALASTNAAMKELPELAREARAMVGEARQLSESVSRLAEEARGTAGDFRNQTLPRTHALAESVEQGANRIGRLAYELERRPQSVLWGRPGVRPGPGEAGFE